MTEDMTGHTPAPLTLKLHWHLQALLDTYGIKRLRLEKAAGVSVNTIIFLCREDTDRFNVSNAQRLLNALRELSGADIRLADLVTISTSDGQNMLSVLGDVAPPAVKAPLFVPAQAIRPEVAPAPAPVAAPVAATQAKAAKPQQRKQKAKKDAPARLVESGPSAEQLLTRAATEGLTVYVLAGTGVNQGNEIAAACASKTALARITGMGKSSIYSPKLTENPEDPQVLADVLAKPGVVFMRKAGASRFTELTA